MAIWLLAIVVSATMAVLAYVNPSTTSSEIAATTPPSAAANTVGQHTNDTDVATKPASESQTAPSPPSPPAPQLPLEVTADGFGPYSWGEEKALVVEELDTLLGVYSDREQMDEGGRPGSIVSWNGFELAFRGDPQVLQGARAFSRTSALVIPGPVRVGDTFADLEDAHPEVLYRDGCTAGMAILSIQTMVHGPDQTVLPEPQDSIAEFLAGGFYESC